MATVPQPSTRRLIEYPTSDGKPMAETPIHGDNMFAIIDVLRSRYAHDPRVYVAGNMLMYYVPNDKRRHVSPDVYLVKDIPHRYRGAYFVWIEGKGPNIVFEISSRSTATKEEMARELTTRLMALGRAQQLVRPVPGRKNEGTLLGDLISVLLAPYDEKGASVRIRVSVPKLNVGEASSTTLALVIHELATNSAKYGALSIASGSLDVSCNANDDDVVVMWTERGGPPVAAPVKLQGFGSKLVHRSMAAQLGGTIAFDWSEEGVVVTLRMSKNRLAH